MLESYNIRWKLMGNTKTGVLVSISKMEIMHSIAKREGGSEVVESELFVSDHVT